jgi:hypothetical protein
MPITWEGMAAVHDIPIMKQTKLRHPADGKVHFSELKAMADCPAMYAHACHRAREMTRPMTVGAVADCIVFGNRGYAIYQGKVRNGKEWDAFKDAHPNEIKCIVSEYDDAAGAAEAVMKDPVARELMAGCRFQDVIQWEAHGIECAAGVKGERGGIDAWRSEMVIDMKVTADVEPEALSRHAWRSLWHAQMAWYQDGLNWIHGTIDLAPRARIIAVRSSAPHLVTVLPVSARSLDIGRKSIALWSEKLRACEAADQWPGYVQGLAPELEPPSWENHEEKA